MLDGAPQGGLSPHSNDDPLHGTAYRTLRDLGAGAMGRVVEAEHQGLRRKVAVKLLAPELSCDPAFKDRLRLEAQALAAVSHPNIVAVLDYSKTPAGVPFLVMELLRGRTLEDLLEERGSLPVHEALALFAQVAAGLGALHSAGLVHRDLKPANVFLVEEQGRVTVKLLDLGIVKIAHPEHAAGLAPLAHPTAPTSAIGTPRCMAPEQIMARPCDARTDVYAAGVLLCMMLAGKDPFFRHHAHMALFTAHVMETPPPLSELAKQPISPALDRAVARALSKEPAHRFASMADFCAALAASPAVTIRIAVLPRSSSRAPAAAPPAESSGGTTRMEGPALAAARNAAVSVRLPAPGALLPAPGAPVAMLPPAAPTAPARLPAPAARVSTPARISPATLSPIPADLSLAAAPALPETALVAETGEGDRLKFLRWLPLFAGLAFGLLATVAWMIAAHAR